MSIVKQLKSSENTLATQELKLCNLNKAYQCVRQKVKVQGQDHNNLLTVQNQGGIEKFMNAYPKFRTYFMALFKACQI